MSAETAVVAFTLPALRAVDKIRYLLLAALPVVLYGQAGGVVEGTVVNSLTHAALAGIEVSVASTTLRNAASYTATTDARGAFHIEGIREEGAFRASAGGPGFMPMSMTFQMTAANAPVRLQLELAVMPKLRGRVVDGEGHAVPDVTVQLVRPGGGGRPSAKSGKDGAFVFEQMLPTNVLLRAIPPRGLQPPKSSAEEPEIWAPTYYPGVTEQFLAQTMTLRPGDEPECEIKLRAVPVFHVRGVIVDDDDKPVSGATVKLVSPDGLDARSHAAFEEPEAQTKSAEDGAFEFAAVRPGEWHLMANGKRGGQLLSAVVTGTVSRSDWENVTVHVKAPFTVMGTVERLGAQNPGSSRHTWVALLPAWQVRMMGVHDQDGAFEIDEVVPGRYQILLEQPLPGFYVDAVQYGGRDVMGQTVDVMDSSLPIHVVYKANGGSVQGLVAQGGGGIVVLLPKEPALQNSEFMRWARCDANGRFGIGNLRPGVYYAAAFERMEMFDLSYGLYYGGVVDPALIAAIAARAASVRVESGQAITVTLPLMAWPNL